MRLAVACVVVLSVAGCASSSSSSSKSGDVRSAERSTHREPCIADPSLDQGTIACAARMHEKECLQLTGGGTACMGHPENFGADWEKSEWQGDWTGTAYAVYGESSTPVTCTFSIGDFVGRANDGERYFAGKVTCRSATNNRAAAPTDIEVKEDGPGLIVMMKRHDVWQRVGLVRLEKNGVRTYFDDDDGPESIVVRPMQLVRR